MDRKAGYKECSRCGLRNKPSALQCDFCGLRFIAGEDWDDNIQALEKMGDNDERVQVDEDVSKRIEATIVKRDKFNAPVKAKEPEKTIVLEKATEPVRIVPAPVVIPIAPPILASKVTVVETPPVIDKVEPAPEPIKTVPAPEEIVIPEPPPVVVAPEPKPEPKPVKEKKTVRRVVRTTPKVFTPVKSTMRRTALTAILALGIIWYLLAIMFGDNSLGRVGGWAMVTVSSMMVVVGAVGLFVPKTTEKTSFVETPAPEEKTNREVLICPRCHELVKATDRACPDCGAEFRSE
jgi:hypothetical protein